MRRSTAAAVGTLTGAALIVGVRLSVSAPALPAAAPPAVDLAGSGQAADRPSPPSRQAGRKKPAAPPADQEANSGRAGGGSGLKDGTFRGKAVANPYGTVQVKITVAGGEVTDAAASYPTTGNSATINPGAVARLKQEVLKAQSAEINAVSGATFTSASYRESLQAALDAAGA
jgi:uncharacterized protein with FMN-binding domain